MMQLWALMQQQTAGSRRMTRSRSRITTNLYQIAQRPGVTAVPIRIHVQAPDGATYSSLINNAGTTTSIMDVPVTSTPYSTGAIWDTGRQDTYPYGTYRIWAECNVNSMKDNYPESGKTYTPGSGLLDQERNPLIGVYTRTATRRRWQRVCQPP